MKCLLTAAFPQVPKEAEETSASTWQRDYELLTSLFFGGFVHRKINALEDLTLDGIEAVAAWDETQRERGTTG